MLAALHQISQYTAAQNVSPPIWLPQSTASYHVAQRQLRLAAPFFPDKCASKRQQLQAQTTIVLSWPLPTPIPGIALQRRGALKTAVLSHRFLRDTWVETKEEKSWRSQKTVQRKQDYFTPVSI